MGGQKVAWVVIVLSAAAMVWLRGKNTTAPESELQLWLQCHGHSDVQSAMSALETNGIKTVQQLMELEEDHLPSWAHQQELKAVVETVFMLKEKENSLWSIGGVLWLLFKILLIIAVPLIIAAVIAMCLMAENIEKDLGPKIIGFAIALIVLLLIKPFEVLLQTITRGANGNRRTGRSRAGHSGPSARHTAPRRGQQRTEFNLGLYDRIRGRYLDVNQCVLDWNCNDLPEVGGSTVITVQLKCKNGSPYQFQASDSFQSSVEHLRSNTVIAHVIEPERMVGEDTIKVTYTTRLSGDYAINLKINGCRLTSSILTRTYRPTAVDASKTTFMQQSNIIVVTSGLYYSMQVVPKDRFGNPAILSQEHLTAEIRRGLSGHLINPECVVDHAGANRYEILLKIEEPGHYVGCVKYQGNIIGPSSITVICLSESDANLVDKNVTKKGFANGYFEAQMLPTNSKPKKVYCYISSKQFQVREYFMGIIPKRTYTCKVCPSTRLIFEDDKGKFTLDDGYQQCLNFYCEQREMLAATFYRFLLKNIGGSEKFQDKRSFFYAEAKKIRSHWNRGDTVLNINRHALLESAMQATRSFSSSDWYRKFNVEFQGEEGLDWGGVSREFFELVCIKLFDPVNKLFARFKDDPQALVHPNPSSKRPVQWKLKHYEFAGRIVGKCLYESALGNPLYVKARFTRSFLAQIIGLRINHKYFESDNPELYTTKIQYIRDNDVADLELMFTEEEYENNSDTPTVVPLIDKGEEIEVTNQNKIQYLNLLAQYQLAKSVREEVESFLKGLNDIIPENLLSMFDENELELLMCGLSTVSYTDLKQYARVNGTDLTFEKVVNWFWTIVSGFTQEEMAKLLQFVTGCSQLPPGGFRELRPPFTVTRTPTHGRLPTAHTCFNQLCLPTYDSYEQFQQALTIAVNEGAEGFGFA